MPNRLIACLISLVLLPATALAQPADLPTPEQVFKEAAHAMGLTPGVADGIGSIEARARVEVEGRTYDTVATSNIGARANGDTRFTMVSEDGTVTYGDTGGTIWFEGEDGARRTLSPTMAAFVHGHQFHRRVLFPEGELKTVDPVVREGLFSDERAFVVSGTTPAGATIEYYFGQRSKLPLGFHLVVEEAEGPHPMDFIIKDWRTSVGQSLFWRMDIDDRGKMYVYRFDQILLLP